MAISDVDMPGLSLSFACGDATESSVSSGDDPAPPGQVRHGLETAAVLDHYTTQLYRESADFAAGAISYEGYPIRELAIDDAWVVLEGRIYEDDPTAVVEQAVGYILEDDVSDLKEWVATTDGEYVLTVYEYDQGRLSVLNDVWGRLPLYRTDLGGRLLLARDIQSLLAMRATAGVQVEDEGFDEMAVAQNLVFGWPLGTRTPYVGVEKLSPGTLLTADADGVSTQSLHTLDFERLEATGKRIETDLDTLVDQYVEACRSRAAPGGKTVVSLSGGHDSRVVAAGLIRAGVDIETATFDRADGVSDRDVPVAELVANELDVPWTKHDLDPLTDEDYQEMLDTKGGMNHVGMAFILPFIDELRSAHGPDFVYATGDGGDKTLPDLTPPRELSGLDELTDYILAKDSVVFSPKRVASMLDLSVDDIRSSLRNRLATYPESDPAQAYKHYLIRERGLNFLVEGEDRNRAYAWSTTPFYSLPFFRTAMSFEDEEKRKNKLYRAFMNELWPEGLEIDDANYGVSMGSPLYSATMWARSFLANHPRLEDLVRVAYRGEVGYRYDTVLANRLRRQVDAGALDGVFNNRTLARMADDRSTCNRQQAVYLLTMTSVVAAPGIAAADESRMTVPQ